MPPLGRYPIDNCWRFDGKRGTFTSLLQPSSNGGQIRCSSAPLLKLVMHGELSYLRWVEGLTHEQSANDPFPRVFAKYRTGEFSRGTPQCLYHQYTGADSAPEGGFFICRSGASSAHIVNQAYGQSRAVVLLIGKCLRITTYYANRRKHTTRKGAAHLRGGRCLVCIDEPEGFSQD